MPLPISESFAGAAADINGRTLDGQAGVTWFLGIGSTGSQTDGAGRAYPNNPGTVSAHWTTATADATDYGAEGVVRVATAAGQIGFLVALTSVTGGAGDTRFYLGRYNQATGNYEIVKYTTGTYAVLASLAGSIADGDTLRIERTVSGSDAVLRLKLNGATVLTVTDAAPGSPFLQLGQFGVWGVGGDASTGYRWDNFLASVNPAGPTTLTLGGSQSGVTGAEAAISLSLDAAAGVGGVVVDLTSATINALFRATSGGANVTQVTIPQGQTVANLFLVPQVAGTGSWSAASSLTEVGSPRTFTAGTPGVVTEAYAAGSRAIGFKGLPPGLVGTAGVTLHLFNVDGTLTLFAARSTAGLSENPLIAGNYRFLVPETFNGLATWDDGATFEDQTVEARASAEVLRSVAVVGSVVDSAPTATGFKGNGGLSAVSNFYRKGALVFTSGALAGVTRQVSAYVGSTRAFAFDEALPAAPANGDRFAVLGRIK